MKRLLLLLPLAALCLFSCKKDNPKPTTATEYSGWFWVSKTASNMFGSGFEQQESAVLTFYDPAIVKDSLFTDSVLNMSGVSAGMVYLNGQEMSMEYDDLDATRLVYQAYVDDAPWHMDSSLVFQIGGSSAIPAFTYNAPGDFLKFTPSFPDTITAASGYTLHLGVAGTGADSMSVVFASGSGVQVVKTYAPGTASVVFTPAELGTLGSGMGFITINLLRQQTYEAGGKKYLLTGENQIIWVLGLN